MRCPFCDHGRVYKHGKTLKGVERFKCPACQHTFTQTFDTVAYRRQVSAAEMDTILQSHPEGVSLRGISRMSGRSIGTVTDIVKQTAQRSQMIHNQEVSEVEGVWCNSWTGDTAAERAGLALEPWTWQDVTNYPTLL
jgi:transposase-like protein